MTDLSDTIVPRSDQLNAEDLLTGPRIVTVVEVMKTGKPDQPVNIVTAEFGPERPYKPCLSMRRVLISAWGADASTWTGRRIAIYRDPSIRFGKDTPGGIRISALSDIPKRIEIALAVARGQRKPFIVEPLPDAPEPEPESEPADPKALTPTARRKWEAAMFAAFGEADCNDRDDQLVVIATLADIDKPEHRNSITDADLRTVVGALNEAKRAGALGDLVADILNRAALAAEGVPVANDTETSGE